MTCFSGACRRTEKYVKPGPNLLLSGDDGVHAIEKYLDLFIS